MSAAAASRDITLVPIPSAPSVSLHISTGDVKKKTWLIFSLSVNLALLSSMPWTPCTGTAMTSPVLWACLFLKVGPCFAGMRWRSGVRQRQTCLRMRWRSTAKTSMISGKTLWVCTESRDGGIIDLMHSDSFSNDSNTIVQTFGVSEIFSYAYHDCIYLIWSFRNNLDWPNWCSRFLAMLKTFVLLSIFVEIFSGFSEESKVQKNSMPLKKIFFCCNVNAFFSLLINFMLLCLKKKKSNVPKLLYRSVLGTKHYRWVMQRAKSWTLWRYIFFFNSVTSQDTVYHTF